MNEKPSKRPEAILFDMGGVLQDATEKWTPETWRRAYPAHLSDPNPFDWFVQMSQECLKTFLMLPVPRPVLDVRPIIAKWLEKRGIQPSEQAVNPWYEAMLWWEVQPVYPHVRPALERLRRMGIRMGLISNTVMPGVRLRWNFREAGILDHFETTVFSAEFGSNKPDPALFRHALAEMRLAPESAWFVGDKPQRDMRGAHAVGMTGVLVDSAHVCHAEDAPENVPDLRIRDISELPALVEALPSAAAL